MDPVYECRLLYSHAHCYIGCNCLVCKQHKLLNKPVCLPCNFLTHINRLAFGIHNHLHLRSLKTYGTAFKTLLAKNCRQLVQGDYSLLYLRLRCSSTRFSCRFVIWNIDRIHSRRLCQSCLLKYLLGLLIGKTSVRFNYCAAKPALYQLCLVVHLKNCREGEFLLIRPQ